jgi:hypothetical protein
MNFPLTSEANSFPKLGSSDPSALLEVFNKPKPKKEKNMEKFEVKKRWSGEVQFVAEIECDKDALLSVKLGLAVVWATSAGANLIGANLIGANLRTLILVVRKMAATQYALC